LHQKGALKKLAGGGRILSRKVAYFRRVQGLIPDFIDRRIAQKQWDGNRRAVVLFADLQGFTRYTASQATSRNQGAEALAHMLNSVFSAASEAVHGEGGFIPYYAGDAFAGIFFGAKADECALRAALNLQAALRILQLPTPLRTGIGAGDIEWHISRDTPHRWLIRGEGIRQAVEVQQFTPPGDIGLHSSLVEALSPHHILGPEGGIFLYQSEAPVERHARSPHTTRHAADCFPAFLQGRMEGAEFREVATLFLAFPQDAAPEVLLRFLSQACMRIEQRKGYVKEIDVSDKGGLLLAFFGAPVSEGAKTENALHAAAALREVTPEGWPLRVGVATGDAFCGLIGDDHRRQYVVAGPSVNLAARLAMQAEPGQILSDHSAAEIAGFRIRQLGAHHFKGFDQPLPVIEVLGLQKSLEQAKPLYPRADFSQEWRRALEGPDPFLRVITGEAGLGKSFVAKTLVRQTSDRWHWLPVEGDPLLPGAFAPLQKAWAPHMAASAPPEEWMQLTALSENRELPARERYERMQHLHNQLLQKPFNGKPVAVLLEQASYLDSGTAGILLHADPPPAPMLITCRHVGELDRPIAQEAVQLLPPLRGEGMQVLAVHLLGGRGSERLLSFLLQTSRGNPFHAEQLLRYLQKRGRLTADVDGVFDVEEDAIRSGGALRDILTERLDALSAGTRSLLKWAALLGRQFDERLLRALSPPIELHGCALEEALTQADEEEFLGRTAPSRWAFRHKLLREVLLDLQMPSWLTAAHRCIADVMETHYADDLDEHLPELAMHCVEGKLTDKARAYFIQAAGVAGQAYQHQEAIRYLEQADALATVPTDKVMIRLKMAQPLVQLGRWPDAMDILSEKIFEEAGDVRIEAERQLALGQIRLLQGDYASATRHLEGALHRCREQQDTIGMGRAQRELSILYFRTGDYAGAEAAIEETYVLLGGVRDVSLAMNLSLIRMNQGRYREAEDLLMDELAYRSQTGEKQPIIPLWVNLGVVRNELGAYDRAREAIDRGYALATAAGNRLWESIALGTRGLIAHNQGRWADAARDFEADLDLARTLGDRQGEAIALELKASLLADCGDTQAARPLLTQSLDLCRQLGYRKGQAKCLLALAAADQADGQPDHALHVLDDALDIAGDMGNQKLTVLARLRMAEVLVQCVRKQEAQPHWVSTASDVFDWEDEGLRARWRRLALQLLEGRELEAALSAVLTDEQDLWTRAEACALLWQMGGNPSDRAEALRLFQQQYALTPHFLIRQRLTWLT
jgi:class 3 adenylate cyclase/tetratricopeptide (TPR) repeat protein